MAARHAQPAAAADELREHVALYLRDRVALAQFVEWFLPWSLDRPPSPGSFEADVEGLIAEYTSAQGHEAELKRLLTEALDRNSQASPAAGRRNL